jgi:flagellar basal body rod protein FlgG
MLKGLYAAASAMLANLTQQGVLSHNLANVQTPGFREVLSRLDPWETTTVTSNPAFEPSGRSQLLGQLGLGVQATDTLTNYAQGPMQSTGQPLDLALEGDGFFSVQTTAGTRYTRDGRFQRDTTGQLVTVDGYKVLGANGAPLKLPDGQVAVDAAGNITVNGAAAGQLGLATFANNGTDLTRDGEAGNMFQAITGPATTGPGTAAAGSVHQGFLEMPNLDVSQLMTQMVTVGRAYEAAQRMVQVQDTLLGKSISSLGGWG